ncbi:MAG TPA: cytochrome c peroxidase, partial [Gemmatimonadaceae bacterium]|nr:cytochrome c peroxidase [Gemmatimonadaceae bacterium]
MLPNPLHPAVVHFPIVLMFLVPVAAIGALWMIRRGAHPAKAWAFAVAACGALTLSAWAAVETGEDQGERIENVVGERPIDSHKDSAKLFFAMSGVLLVVTAGGLLRGEAGRAARVVSTLGALGLLGAGYQVGHSGGALVYGENGLAGGPTTFESGGEEELTSTKPGTMPSDAELSRPIATAELALFARLPQTMAAPEAAPTAAQIALGRRLYYETLLSRSHAMSCNSCHPLNAYGADGRSVSLGDRGQPGGRNAPTVYNAAGAVAQFWDGRAPTVEAQAKGPILNPAEMGMPDSASVLAHIESIPSYVADFSAAFPNDRTPITYDNVGRAIGAFERGLVTPARWDRFLGGDELALNVDERHGFTTFVRVGCVSCHNGAYVGGNSYQKLGRVSPWPALADSGRFNVTHAPADVHVFKVAALRNVEKTAPYLHDGSISSLPTMIRMMGQHQLGVTLTESQVRDIRSWLQSLT